MIVPSIGRVVWFRKYRPLSEQEQAEAAMITYVHTERLVNLVVFDAYGKTRSECSITLVQEGDDAPQVDYAEWMPYQIGQAKKEAAQ